VWYCVALPANVLPESSTLAATPSHLSGHLWDSLDEFEQGRPGKVFRGKFSASSAMQLLHMVRKTVLSKRGDFLVAGVIV
jgi:hypothetical protein